MNAKKIPIVSLVPHPMENVVLDAAVRVTEYDHLYEYIDAFAAGKLPLLFIVGGPGTGKSVAMRNATDCAAKVCWINNTASAWGLYCRIYDEAGPRDRYEGGSTKPDRPIVLDDVDEIYRDKKCVSLLKALCQSDKEKELTWTTQNKQIRDGEYPNRYKTTSTVCLIANDWRQVNVNIAALESRGKLVMFMPSNQEIHKYVGKWFKDKEIYKWIGEHITGLSALDVRHYVQALADKNSSLNWQRDLLHRWQPDPKRLAIYQLFDPEGQYVKLTRDQKVAKWKQMIGGGRGGSKNAMYHWKKVFGYGNAT